MLLEATVRVGFQTAREVRVQEELVKLLRRNRHNKYADRLDYKNKPNIFYIKIVPASIDPDYSASMDDKNHIIRVGEGFIVDLMNPPDERYIFNQLDVVIRHEIAHFYMRHQKRFAKIFPEYDRLCKSSSLFDFLNIVADDEISNTRYTDEDKKIIRAQKLNGEVVKGLVTEDHREDWKNLNLEQMVKKLEQEIDEDNEKLINGTPFNFDERMPEAKKGTDEWNPTTAALLNAYNAYQDIYADSSLPGANLAAFKKWIDNGYWFDTPRGRQQIAGQYRDIIKKIYDSCIAENPDDAELDKLLNSIAKSKINQKVYLFSGKNKIDLYTPEEKFMGEETLKKFRSEQNAWYTKVLDYLNSQKVGEKEVSTFWDDKMKGN